MLTSRILRLLDRLFPPRKVHAAYDFVAANEQHLTIESAIFSNAGGTPRSIVVLFNADNATAEHALFWIGDKDIADAWTGLAAVGSVAGDPIQYFYHENGGPGTDLYRTSSGYSADTWHYAQASVAEFPPNASGTPAVYLDGAGESNTDLVAANAGNSSTWDRTAIGGFRDSTPSGWLDGTIAYVAVWDIQLTDAQMSQLAAGRHPRNVSGGDLSHLWTFQSNGDLTDEIAAQTLVAGGTTGTPTWEANPVFIWTGSTASMTSGDTGVELEGTGFDDTEGAGKLELGDNSDYGSASLVEQTTTAWADDKITYSVNLGGLTAGTLWLFVTNDDGNRSAGFEVTVAAGDVTVTPPTLALTLATFAPTVSTPRLVTPPVESLVATGYAPSVTIGVRVTPPTASLTTTGYAPTVGLGPVTVTPGTVALTTTGYAPTVTVQADVSVTVPAGALTITTYAPRVVTLARTLQAWAVVYDESGSMIGALTRLMGGTFVRRRVSQVGDFVAVVPASDAQAANLQSGYGLQIYYGLSDNNPRMIGRIDRITTRVADNGQDVVVAEGPSRGIELEDLNTYDGVIADDDTVSDIVDALLADATGWTKAVTGSGYVDLTHRFRNVSIWGALTYLAEVEGAYIRETDTDREIEIKRGTTSTGITLRNLQGSVLPHAADPAVGFIRSIGGVRVDSSRVRNRVVPQGVNASNIIYDLGLSTRSTGGGDPYDVQSFIKNRAAVTSFWNDRIPNPASGDEGNFDIEVLGPNSAIVVATATAESAVPAELLANGKAFRKLGETAAAESRVMALWIVEGIAPGTVTVTLTGINNTHVTAIALRDVLQSGADRDSDFGSGTGTSASLSLTSDDDDLVLDILHVDGGVDRDLTPGAGQTAIDIVEGDVAPSGNSQAASEEDGDDAGVTMSWTWTGSDGYWHVAVSIKSAPTYYLEDATSKAAYGGPNSLPRTEILTEPGNALIGATSADLIAAANALYDGAAAFLARLKDPITYYDDVRVLDLVDDSWLVGDSFPVRGVWAVEDLDGTGRAWLTVDESALYAIEVVEAFRENGPRDFLLKLATAYEWPADDPQLFAQLHRNVGALASTLVRTT